MNDKFGKDGEDFGKDPVHQELDKWYYWDETWSYRHGPYSSEIEARSELEMYCNWLNSTGGQDEEQKTEHQE